MTAAKPMRRGACPGLTTPMPTGDGLLARLMPVGTISLDAMAGLCAAALEHGNGILEITSRGSLQVRGLSETSAPKFADAVAQLGIAAQEGVPVISDPLAGLDPGEVIDAGALGAKVRARVAKESFAGRLSPKVSVAIDGGGAVRLDALTADIRLDTIEGPRLQVAIGGDAVSALPRGTIAVAEAADTVLALLREIAARGPEVRGRDLARGEAGGAPVPPPQRQRADPIGRHHLRHNKVAVGIGFPVGHTHAGTFNNLLRVAHDLRAGGFRTAPGRALLVVGLTGSSALEFTAAARRWGYITEPRDPRRRIIACAGAPICKSGEIEARALTPPVARGAIMLLRRDEMIHISGCAKCCAHQGAATLTVIGRDGRCDLFVDGKPAGSCLPEQLERQLGRLASARIKEGPP